jgi:hypothetical protein
VWPLIRTWPISKELVEREGELEMGAQNRNFRRRYGTVCIAMASLACAPAIMAHQLNAPKPTKWSVKGTGLQLVLQPEELVITPKLSKFWTFTAGSQTTEDPAPGESLPDAIPLSSIVAIVVEEGTHKPIEEARNRTLKELEPDNLFNELSEAGEAAPALPVVLLAQAGGLQVFHNVRTRTHAVRIIWEVDGALCSTYLALSDKDADSLSGRLQEVTGKQAIVARFDNAVDTPNARDLLVRFKEPITFGNVTGWPGTYHILILTAATGEKLIYFFSEIGATPRDAMLVLPAQAFPLDGARPWKVKLAPHPNGTHCVYEIVTDQERLRVPSCSTTKVDP